MQRFIQERSSFVFRRKTGASASQIVTNAIHIFDLLRRQVDSAGLAAEMCKQRVGDCILFVLGQFPGFGNRLFK